MKTTKTKSYQFGLFAEFIATIFLRLRGYKILAQRYKTYVGEIDIVASKGKCLIAVEVKARKNIVIENGFLIDEVVTKNQRQRIKRAIISFVKSNHKKYHSHNIRFDLMVISRFKFPVHFVGFWE